MKKVVKLTESDLTKIVKRVVNENVDKRREIGTILDDILYSFEFSEKGNDELILLAKFILENPEMVANKILSKLKKGYGAHDEDKTGFGEYTTLRGDLKNLKNKLGEK